MEWEFIHHRVEKRKQDGKESVVFIDDTPMPAKKLKKEMSRHFPPTFQQRNASGNILIDSLVGMPAVLTSYEALSLQTPEGTSIRTPPGLATHAVRLGNLPWFQFQEFMERHSTF